MDKWSKIAIGLVGTGVLAASVSASAQSNNNNEADAIGGGAALEEIVVTARRVEESLQDTPISLSAFSSQQLQDRSLTNLVELGAFTPNVNMNSAPAVGSSSSSSIFIRGIGQADDASTTDPGVGTYIDGVYHARALGGVLGLLDLERIEILRGPQGTLFGKNTIGGAISLITVKPHQEVESLVELTAGSFDRMDVRVLHNQPLSDTVAARFSASVKRKDGYSERLDFDTGATIGDLSNIDEQAARIAVRWDLDTTTVDFTADYVRRSTNTTASALVQFIPTASLLPLWNNLVGIPSGNPIPADPNAFRTNDPYKTFADGASRDDYDEWGTSLTIEHEFERFSAKSITAYRETDGNLGRDLDGTPLPLATTFTEPTGNQLSQEFQIRGNGFDDRLNWVAGAFYFTEENSQESEAVIMFGLFDGLEALPGAFVCLGPGMTPPCLGGAGNPLNSILDLGTRRSAVIETTSYALFTHFTFSLTERLSVSGGLRYAYEEKDFEVATFRVRSNTTEIPFTRIGDDWLELLPKIGLEYQVSDDILVYASFAKGFKSGGFNARAGSAAELEPFDPEFVSTYEIGLKSEWFDNRLRFNGAAFFSDYTDIQLQNVSATDLGDVLLLIENVGEAELSGFELELTALPLAFLELSAGAGYIDAKYTKLGGGVSTVTTSSSFAKAPRWNLNFSAQFTLPVGNNGRLRIRADSSYQSEVFNEPANIPSVTTDSVWRVNARAVYEQLEQGWEVALFVTNLTDAEVIAHGLPLIDALGFAEAIYAPPREFGISFTKRFGG